MPLVGKRRRTGFTVKRPVDKKLTVIQKNSVAATQQTTVLIAPTAACTVVGFRWSFFVNGDGGTEGVPHDYQWVIVHQRDGSTISTLSTSDASSLYSPEQDVLAFGVGQCRQDSTSVITDSSNQWNGISRASRRMMVGDQIVFVIDGIATETVRVKGCVQLFCKY